MWNESLEIKRKRFLHCVLPKKSIQVVKKTKPVDSLVESHRWDCQKWRRKTCRSVWRRGPKLVGSFEANLSDGRRRNSSIALVILSVGLQVKGSNLSVALANLQKEEKPIGVFRETCRKVFFWLFHSRRQQAR